MVLVCHLGQWSAKSSHLEQGPKQAMPKKKAAGCGYGEMVRTWDGEEEELRFRGGEGALRVDGREMLRP